MSMSASTIHGTDEQGVRIIELDDPGRRNALTVDLLDGLIAQLEACAERSDIHAVLLRGRGPCFCAGFDLQAVVDEPKVLDELIERLSNAIRTMRRLPQVVVVAAHGAAIAGGCALLTGADAVFVDDGTTAGYPVHPLGVSPAVTIPTLRQRIGDGRARELLLGGRLVRGRDLVELGLATHWIETEMHVAALEWARGAAGRSSNAMRTTKRWVNELDGSHDDASFDGPVDGSRTLTGGAEAIEMLKTFWNSRRT
tara:strand:- start:12289 stop:13050 length:762 start_codon:yes stop_codon:yes gene_type:complete